jgi:hypothetical protein
MRPKGKKDSRKRKVKKFLSRLEEIQAIEKYREGLSLKNLSEHYDISKSALSALFKRRNIKCRVNNYHLTLWKKIDNVEKMKKNACGVYCIYFVNKTDGNDIKIYIGSSVNIKNRLKDHISALESERHSSPKLFEFFKNDNYTMHIAIMQECKANGVLEQESKMLGEFDSSCLINTWKPTKQEDILPWLKKAITLESYKNYTLTDTGCWESNYIHKSGYARLAVVAFRDWGVGEKKFFYSHRVAYWEKHGEYPELVRHKCGNSKCKNPDHLEKGNYRDNALDKRGDFPDLFEKKWLEFGGDPVKLSEYFSDRWSANQKWKDAKISFAVYDWEIKLNLRKKHPEVLDSNENRRFSIEYQKKRKNKKKRRATKQV